MHGRESAVGSDLPGLKFTFVVFVEAGLTHRVDRVVFVHVELVLITLEWFHIKVLHLIQSLENPFFIVSWELGVAFEQVEFADLLETLNQFEVRAGP